MEDKTLADPKANKNWPAWRYGPDGKSGIFDREEDVPTGWTDHPDNVGKTEAEKPSTNADGEEIDNFGVTWNADVNTPDKSKTKGGLWKLLPGKSRPAPAEGFPKETFDL